METRRTLKALLLVLFAAVALFIGGVTVASAAAGDAPAHSKTIEDNGDGTYKLELSVTGDSETEEQSDTHINVLIIYDESSSMVSNNDNPRRADIAEDAMYTFVNGLLGYANQGVDIYMAEVGFGTGSNTRSNWTNNLVTIRGHFDQGVDGSYNGNAHGNYGYNGTNWASAFDRADTLLGNLNNVGGQNRSSYPTFVVLVTDGGPTAGGGGGTVVPGPTVPWTSYRPHYMAAVGDARSIQNGETTTLYGIYALGTDANLLDDLMYYANTGNHRSVNGYAINTASQNQHNFGRDEGADNYYGAADADELNDAIAEIFNEIVEAIGITGVSMSDGTTSQVTASSGEVTSLLGVDEDSYQYWMTIPLDGNNQFQRTKNVNDHAENITYTVADNGDGTCTITWTEGGSSKTVTVDGSISSNQLRFEWTQEDFPNDFYEFAPNSAELVDGAVEWDLSNVGTLLNGVTYSVTFDVYPSQTAMDYKARLENGEDYEDVVPEEARPYFDENGGLDTNTEGTITYSDTRLENPGPRTTDFENPPAISTQASTMSVEKTWEGGTAPDIDLEVDVIMDGDTEHPFETVTLNSAGGWASDIHISYGIMRDGEVLEDAPGHDFSFAELGPEQYRWELVAPTVHPMIVDGEPTMLIKVDENFPLGDHDPIEIDSETYYIDEEIASLSAINYRRSNLTIAKTVTGTGAPSTATFPFTITVTDARAEMGSADDTNSDYYVWFAIRDASGAYITDVTITGATKDSGSNYYYAPSSTPLSIDMKAGWTVRFINLPSGSTYTATEGDTAGFRFVSAESTGAEDETFEVEGKTASGTIVTYNAQAYEATFTNEYAQTTFTFTKVWDDDSNNDGIRPTAAEYAALITLSPNPNNVTPTVTDNGDDTYTVTYSGLDRYDAQGQEITYTVTESSITDYTPSSTTVSNNGSITNSHETSKISVTANKIWEDNNNQDGIRPSSVSFQLYADGEKVGDPVTLNVDSQWSYTWTGLNEYDDGEPIEYTVTEVNTPTGYDASVSQDGLTVTNTHTPAKVDLTVTKEWDDADNQDGIRPDSIQVQLYANGEPVGDPVELNADNNWSYDWTGMDKCAGGSPIEYTVEEVADTIPDGYEMSDESETDPVVDEDTGATGALIINVHEPEMIEVHVQKAWDDNDNQDGKRPSSVTVTLLANGQEVASASLSEESGWEHTFSVPRYDDGQEIEYSIAEVEVEGYTSSILVVEGGHEFIVTNTHEPSTTSVSVNKVWSDSDNRDNLRPDSVTVQLYADGSAYGDPVTLSEDNGWANTWTDLPEFREGEQGVAIEYTVEEVDVPEGYTAKVTGSAKKGYTVTNTHEAEVTSVTVSKVWDDADNKDGIRPSSVTVTLIADGAEVGTCTLSADNGWTYTFENLPVYSDGQEIEYTVAEVQVEGYESTLEGNAADGFTFTNVHEPEPEPKPKPKPKPVPQTSDPIEFLPMIALAVLGGGAAITGTVLRKRDEH